MADIGAVAVQWILNSPKSKSGILVSGDIEIGQWSLAGAGFKTGATERALIKALLVRRSGNFRQLVTVDHSQCTQPSSAASSED